MPQFGGRRSIAVSPPETSNTGPSIASTGIVAASSVSSSVTRMPWMNSPFLLVLTSYLRFMPSMNSIATVAPSTGWPSR